MPSTDSAKLPITIVIADDHPIFREGLMRLIETRPDLKVVAAASDGRGAIDLVTRLQPDLLLLDLAMPGMSGLVGLRELKEVEIRTRILVLTAAIEQDEIATALQLGARGVVLKETTSDLLFKSIDAVMSGQYWVGRATVDLATTLRQLASQPPTVSRRNFGLTPRELEIVSFVLSGYSNGDIATRFRISEKTVKHHLTNIFDKTGVSNRLELALFALHHGLEMPAAGIQSDATPADSETN